MPYIDGNRIKVLDARDHRIEIVQPKAEGQCVSMVPPSKAVIQEKGGVHGHLTITVQASSTHKAVDMAKLIAACIFDTNEMEAE